jgi:hypothetical protein
MTDLDGPKYAEQTCDGCFIKLPGNQMTKVEYEALETRTITPRQHKSSDGRPVYLDTEGVKYRAKTELLCPTCYNARLDRERAEREAQQARLTRIAAARRRTRLLKLAVFAFLIIAVAYFVILHPVGPETGNITANGSGAILDGADPNAIPTAPALTLPPAIAVPAPAFTPPPVIKSEPAPTRDPAFETQEGVPVGDSTDAGPSRTDEAATDDRADIDRAILTATPQALESGEPERWKASGKSGYVVVSAPQDYADRTCRNVYATIIDHQAQTQSVSHQWCRSSGGGEWAPN